MKKIALLFCVVCFFSFSGFAKPGNTGKKHVNFVQLMNQSKFVDITIQLSCCTVSFTGASGDFALWCIQNGYGAAMVGYLEGIGCSGGGGGTPYAYA